MYRAVLGPPRVRCKKIKKRLFIIFLLDFKQFILEIMLCRESIILSVIVRLLMYIYQGLYQKIAYIVYTFIINFTKFFF